MWQQISKNQRCSFIAMFFLGVIFLFFSLAVAVFIAGEFNLYFTIFTFVLMFAAYIYLLFDAAKKPDSVAFGVDVYNCEKLVLDKLNNIVYEMQIASGLEHTPKVYVLDTDVANAFACGLNSKNSSIYVTRGLLKKLNRSELQGVIAHEIAHIKNKDTTFLLNCGIIVTLIAIVANALGRSTRSSSRSSKKGGGALILISLIAIILAPVVSQLFYFFISREREFLADACAVKYTRFPEALASALKKLARREEDDESYKDNPLIAASAIVPFEAKKESESWFSTHPSTDKRIRVLLKIQGADYLSYNKAYMSVTGQKGIIAETEIKSKKRIPIKKIKKTENQEN